MKILSLDIGGTAIKYGIFQNGKMITDLMTAATKGGDKESTMLIIDDILKKHGKEVDGLAISTPGSVTAEGYLNGVTAIKGWDHFYVKEEIEKLGFDKHISVINDGNAATVAEFDAKSNEKNIATIAIGSGMGAGIVIDGKIVVGKDGFGGEIGYTSSLPFMWDKDNPMSFESGSGASGFYMLMQRYEEETGESKTGKEIFDLYDAKDTVAIKLINNFYMGIAIIIWNLVFTLNLDAVYIAGGLSQRKQSINEINETFDKLLNFRNVKEKNIIAIKKAKYAHESGLIGAYKHHIQERGK